MNTAFKAADEWAPIRRGVFYGSPRCCGAKLCAHAAFQQATKEADALAARMGDGWEPRVWENLGWHYEVTKGIASIGPHRAGSAISGGWKVAEYWCSIGGHNSDSDIPQFEATAQTPEDALGNATQDARTSARRIEAALAALID